MAGKAIFLAGLPGSGKSGYVEKLEGSVRVFDDYKEHAFNDCRSFDHGRRLQELLAALHAGETCVIADIDFCEKSAQVEAEMFLRKAIPGLSVEWRMFENDPDQCRSNVRVRAATSPRDLPSELRNIEKYSAQYSVPAGTTILPVRRSSN